jgi:ribose transport system substrate-binding protein
MVRQLRRAPAALLLLAAGAALAGCERKGADRFVVGFSQMESDNPWRNAETQSLRDEAQKRGVELVVTDAQGQTAKQVADVEDLIARRVSVILLAPREFEGLAPRSGGEGGEHPGHPRRPAGRRRGGHRLRHLPRLQLRRAGAARAEWLAKTTNGTAKIVELSAPRLVGGADRAKGFRDELAKHPGMSIVASQTGQLHARPGRARDAEPRAVARRAGHRPSTRTTTRWRSGAIQALKAAGRQPGKDVTVCRSTGSGRRSRPSSAGSSAPRSRATRASGRSPSRPSSRCGRASRCRPSGSSPTASSTRGNAAQFVGEAY